MSNQILRPASGGKRTLTIPDGWQQTEDGMRSLDGGHAICGFFVGTDRLGERVIVQPAAGGDEHSARPGPDLGDQLEVMLRVRKLDAEPAALARLADDLAVTIQVTQSSAQDDFYGKLVGGDLYKLLAGQGGGIGQRQPWDVASVMREGPQPKTMLVPEWLVAGELHWIAAEPAAGKTWFGLWLAWRVIAAGGVVVWTDEELGVDTVAERLLALGANPDLIEHGLVYLPYPGWQHDAEDTAAWVRLVKAAKPSLVVIDTATDALAEAGVDENSGAEVTKWVKSFCEPPRQIGAAVLVLDHVVKSGSGQSRGYAVGSRAKKAKAKVQFQFDTTDDYDRDRTGLVNVKLTKNGIGGTIPTSRSFRVGGDGAGRFIIEELGPVEAGVASGAAEREDKRADLRDACEAVIREQGPINTTELKEKVKGNATEKSKALAELADSDLYPVKKEKDGKAWVYRWTGE